MTALRAVSPVVLLACAIPALAQSSSTCDQTLTAPMQPRAFLFIDSRPAGLEVVGTDLPELRVTCKHEGSSNYDPDRIHLRFSPNSTGGKLSIEGTHFAHENNLQIRIEVPRKTNLAVRIPAGEVKLNEVAGDKDVYVYAGQITISDHDWNYRSVDASVSIGQVNAPMYNAEKGGFFRSISKQSPEGAYRLHAHVTTGQIDLRGRKEPPGAARRPD
jgi:hypothetical protein